MVIRQSPVPTRTSLCWALGNTAGNTACTIKQRWPGRRGGILYTVSLGGSITNCAAAPHMHNCLSTTFTTQRHECSGGGGGQTITARGGGGGRETSKPIAKNCGEIAEKMRGQNQASRSLKEQHFCTGGSDCFCVSSNLVHRHHSYRGRPSISPRSRNRRQVDIVIQFVLLLGLSATRRENALHITTGKRLCNEARLADNQNTNAEKLQKKNCEIA